MMLAPAPSPNAIHVRTSALNRHNRKSATSTHSVKCVRVKDADQVLAKLGKSGILPIEVWCIVFLPRDAYVQEYGPLLYLCHGRVIDKAYEGFIYRECQLNPPQPIGHRFWLTVSAEIVDSQYHRFAVPFF